MGLIAAYEYLAQRRLERVPVAWPTHWLARAGRAVLLVLAGMAMTTLIASALTALPAVYHFDRPSLYSLPANLLALPVVTFVVMPAATVAGLLMPLGLERLPLLVMGWGIDHVIWVADWVAHLPAAGMLIHQPPALAVLPMAAGAIWFCLWRNSLRWLAAVPALAGLALSGSGHSPDVLFEAQGRNAAIRNAQGHLVPANARRGKFAVARWLGRDGDPATLEEAANRPGWRCTDKACTAEVNGRHMVYILADGFAPDVCANAAIVLAAVPLRRACRTATIRIDRFDVWRQGSQSIRIDTVAGTLDRQTAASVRGDRPWVVRPVARRRIRSPDNPLPAWSDSKPPVGASRASSTSPKQRKVPAPALKDSQ